MNHRNQLRGLGTDWNKSPNVFIRLFPSSSELFRLIGARDEGARSQLGFDSRRQFRACSTSPAQTHREWGIPGKRWMLGGKTVTALAGGSPGPATKPRNGLGIIVWMFRGSLILKIQGFPRYSEMEFHGGSKGCVPPHPESQIQWLQHQGCWKSEDFRMNARKTGLEGSDSHWKTGISWISEVSPWDGWEQSQGCWKNEDLRVNTRKTGLEGSHSHWKTGISWIWEVSPWDEWQLSSIWDKIPTPPKLNPAPHPRERISLHENTQRRIRDLSKTWETPPNSETP